jgi:hypothetical protein
MSWLIAGRWSIIFIRFIYRKGAKGAKKIIFVEQSFGKDGSHFPALIIHSRSGFLRVKIFVFLCVLCVLCAFAVNILFFETNRLETH